MCGIIGYLGTRQAAPVLLDGLKKLEYRGYDSAGIALKNGSEFVVVKRKGRVAELESAKNLPGTIGVGHTRWATHGEPSERNAHPHVFGKFALVHNGIIENHLALREECKKEGESFSSETDSEVIAHLLSRYDRGDGLETLKETTSRLNGSYALAVLKKDEDAIYAAREKSPLVIGKGKDGVYLSSDIPAIASLCGELFLLDDGEFAKVTENSVEFFNRKGKIEKKPISPSAIEEFPKKGLYRHYMRKEMAEIPAAIAKSLINFYYESRFLPFCKVLCQTEYLQIVACGTAYHSGLAAKYAMEALARVPVEVTVASEYRYRNPIVGKGGTVIAVSQSGETADTLAAAELAKQKGAFVVAVTNAPDSSLTRLSDLILVTGAGKEIAVAATKSFNAQLSMLYSIAIALAKAKEKPADFELLRPLPMLAEETLSRIDELNGLAPEFARSGSVYFIGRGPDHCAALEGSLKLKEISYIPSEGYAAGELKHGTLALIEEGTPVVAILTRRAVAEKTMNAVSEVYARGGKVLLITSLPEYAARKEVFSAFLLPACSELFSPVLSVIPLQALAYFTALERGLDPDKPRNLAKSVTVE